MSEDNIDQSDFAKLVEEFNRGNMAWGELKKKYRIKEVISPLDSSNEEKVRDKYGPDLPEFVNLTID